MNERLRTAMVRRGLAVAQLAETCAVDPKSVERWISLGRIPHRRHRWTVAHKLGVDETYLWPDLLLAANRSAPQTARSEILETYPDRASVPREVWLRLLNEAQEQIEILVFSGTFYAQTQPRIARMLTERLAAGVHVRLCFGEPNSRAVAIRDSEEGLGGTLGAKIRRSPLRSHCFESMDMRSPSSIAVVPTRTAASHRVVPRVYRAPMVAVPRLSVPIGGIPFRVDHRPMISATTSACRPICPVADTP